MGIFDFFKKPEPMIKSVVVPAMPAREPIDPEKWQELVHLLSDGDLALLNVLELYLAKDEAGFQKAFQGGIEEYFFDEFDKGGLAGIEISQLALYGLIYFGYIGHNDWKFGMDDFLFNSAQALKHYGLDVSMYDSVENQSEIMAPESFKVIQKGLPEDMGLALWENDSDEYSIIISKMETLKKAEKLAEELSRSSRDDFWIIFPGLPEQS